MTTKSPFSRESEPVDVDGLEASARLLIAHGRREDALELVSEAIGFNMDPRALLLFARLHLESGTKDDAAVAVDALNACRSDEPRDFEVVALLRGALQLLGRSMAASKLDREVRWTGFERGPRFVRGADKERA